MDTGENTQGLRGIIDFLRLGSIFVLVLHVYIFCYAGMQHWQLTHPYVERVLLNLQSLPALADLHINKSLALGLLAISLIGSKGKKDEKIQRAFVALLLIFGLLLYYCSAFVFYLPLSPVQTTSWYSAALSAGFLLCLSGGARLSRLIKVSLRKDIFNLDNETFPQQEELIETEYTVNIPGIYQYERKKRRNWVNINGMRGVLLCGNPGSGKSRWVVNTFIRQHIAKSFSVLLYDFKYDDLTKIAYNSYLKYKSAYKVPPKFYVINFDDLNYSHRCNPLDPSTMRDITDASESARTILLSLNLDWQKRSGEFFIESPIIFMTAVIWYLRLYQNGQYCTLPHVIELMQMPYDQLFPVLASEPTLENYVNVFTSAYLNRAMEQLEGQVASAKIALARLSSPTLYYVLSGSEFTLDINNPKAPKIVCLANNPEKTMIYGAVLSLYMSRVFRILPKKGSNKSSIILDECSSLLLNQLPGFLAICRGYLVSVLYAVQDFSQLKKMYGREEAEVMMNIAGTVISGQVSGDTAEFLSKRFGRIEQVRESISINRTDTSVSKSTQLENAIPPSRIANLSSGEFVGSVADTPDHPIQLKTFHCHLQLDEQALKSEEDAYQPLPQIRNISNVEIQNIYISIKNDAVRIIEAGIKRITDDPNLAHLLIAKD